MSLQPVVRNVPQTDLISELRFFLKGSTKKEKCSPLDLTKSALTLLKSLPATRIAVFEYFRNVFDSAALNYIEGVEVEIKTGKVVPISESDEHIISDIHSVFAALISENPVAWAPCISTWSLELLGEISTKYAGRAHFSANLNETLQVWMTCRATRSLVDINTKCLSSLIHSGTDACISALLDASVKHSPHFDWVVAHVGSCFPNTVITRVLSVGLKDFSLHKSYEQVNSSPKLKSVVGILGHLAGSHVEDIRKAILEMFKWSLSEGLDDTESTRLQKKATVPYILQLIHLSPTLLRSVCSDTKNTLTPEVIAMLYYLLGDWIKYFGTPEALEELIVSLILRCDSGGVDIIKLLLDCIQIRDCKGTNEMKQDIIEKSKEILVTVIQEIDGSVRKNNPVAIVSSFKKEHDKINKMLFSNEKIAYDTACRIVIFLGHIEPAVLIKSIEHILRNASNAGQLSLLIKCLSSDLIDKSLPPYDNKSHLSIVLEQILNRYEQKFYGGNEEKTDLGKMWSNLYTLLQWEKQGVISLAGSRIVSGNTKEVLEQLNKTGRTSILQSRLVSKAIEDNLIKLTSLFATETLHIHDMSDILDALELPSLKEPSNVRIEVVLNLTQSTVNYFFACCKDDGTSNKLRGFKKVRQMLKRLCTYSKVARVLALRELLERSLFRSDNVLFGAKSTEHGDASEKALLKQNNKINKTIPLTKHSSVFNGGIIGSGKRKSVAVDELPEDFIAANTQHLIGSIRACCALQEEQKYSDLSRDGMTLLSLLMVQFVSPDVMYNGLPWPEEEFSKVTMERDLFIQRLFATTPLLWDLLSFVAVYRPAICYCSVLLRALTATLIHQWKSMGEQSKADESENYKSLMDMTVKVIDIMALGQLLPPPLSSIRDVIPYLKCYEIVSILRDCIWSYMKDHIPSPTLFGRDANDIYWRDPVIARAPDIYTNTLRIIMQRNIKSLGHIYGQMFINIPRHD
ncbi:unnamed protein product [Acanthoscelides obtectus]|uniref:Integrator complex subunit 5 n=1 Tax=Acanthoscelides obtectus TaxID=200917 RepID=A0A9P0KQ74_ACAOB|nr:unnamed protein product [Acanthoscelides obtectus]CAK1658302.1 Integrator complex subunit 5 [Acanthoscelides obtectus]